MAVSLDENGNLVEVDEAPDRVAQIAAPAPAPTAPAQHAALPKHSTGDVGAELVDNLKGAASTIGATAFDALMAPARALGADVHGRKLLESLVALGGGGNEQALEYTEEQRKWAEEHPYLHGASELVGTAAGGFGLGRAAEAGVEALGLGRTAQAVGAGAVEGAAQSLSGASEDAYIRNTDLTGEQMLAAMGWGALIGGGTGLAVSKAAQSLFGRAGSRGTTPLDSPRVPGLEEAPALGAAREAGEAAGGEAARPFSERFAEKLRGFSEERTAKAIGARGSDIRGLGKTAEKAEAEMRRMTRDVLEGKLEDGTPIFKAVQPQDELVSNLVRAREEAGSALGAFREKVGTYIDNEAPALRPKPAEIADRIEAQVIAPLEQSVVPQVRSKANDVRGIVDGLRSLGDDVSLEQLQGVRQELASVIYPKKIGPGLPPMPPASAAELQQAERIIEDEVGATIDRAATKMGGEELGRYAELKAKYRSYREAAQIAGKADLQDLGNRVVSPSDYMAGVGGALMHGNPVTGVVSAAVHHTVREHSSAVLAVLADRLAQTVDRKIGKGVDDFFTRALGQAAKAQPANDVTAAATAPVATRRAASAGALATPLALFMGKEKDKQKAYRARAAEVLEANADFGARIRNRSEATLGDLPTKAPKLAASLVTTATRGAQFLSTKLPSPIVNAQSFTPRSSVLPVSDVELHKFARYWSAVSSPLSTLDDLRRGKLTPEQVEATRAVYPELYTTIVTKVQTTLRELDAKGTFIPYTARLQLDLLLGLDGAGEPTASPAFIARFQQMQAQSEAGGGREQGPTPANRPINIAPRLRSGLDAMVSGEPQ
jgi:hypothetical protein